MSSVFDGRRFLSRSQMMAVQVISRRRGVCSAEVVALIIEEFLVVKKRTKGCGSFGDGVLQNAKGTLAPRK